jgi:flagellar motor switch protein FliN/FliY
MALREVAALTPGSVIGFERSIDEPVELMINGHVVALGEAVTVKGSYGIRISEISSRRERLLTSSLAAQEQTL